MPDQKQGQMGKLASARLTQQQSSLIACLRDLQSYQFDEMEMSYSWQAKDGLGRGLLSPLNRVFRGLPFKAPKGKNWDQRCGKLHLTLASEVVPC